MRAADGEQGIRHRCTPPVVGRCRPGVLKKELLEHLRAKHETGSARSRMPYPSENDRHLLKIVQSRATGRVT
jgi:hypothetical protein